MSPKINIAERAANYFGAGNVAQMEGVPLGRYRYAWVDPERIWVYDEEYRPKGFVVPLTDRMRQALANALTPGASHVE